MTALATTASVASSATSVTLFSASASISRSIYNESTATLYVKYGANATTSDYTVQIPPSGFFEFPLPVYDGRVDGIWASANGFARMTSW